MSHEDASRRRVKFQAIMDMATDEGKKLEPLAAVQAPEEFLDFMDQVMRSVRDVPKKLKLNENAVQKYLKAKPPNYKGVTDDVQENVSVLSTLYGQIIDQFKKLKDDKRLIVVAGARAQNATDYILDLKKEQMEEPPVEVPEMEEVEDDLPF